MTSETILLFTLSHSSRNVSTMYNAAIAAILHCYIYNSSYITYTTINIKYAIVITLLFEYFLNVLLQLKTYILLIILNSSLKTSYFSSGISQNEITMIMEN